MLNAIANNLVQNRQMVVQKKASNSWMFGLCHFALRILCWGHFRHFELTLFVMIDSVSPSS